MKAIFDVIGPFINMTLEQFEIGFMRDMHPESEVALWFRITKAWLAYHEDFLANETLPDEDERKMLGGSDCDFHGCRGRGEAERARRGRAQADSVLQRNTVRMTDEKRCLRTDQASSGHFRHDLSSSRCDFGQGVRL